MCRTTFRPVAIALMQRNEIAMASHSLNIAFRALCFVLSALYWSPNLEGLEPATNNSQASDQYKALSTKHKVQNLKG